MGKHFGSAAVLPAISYSFRPDAFGSCPPNGVPGNQPIMLHIVAHPRLKALPSLPANSNFRIADLDTIPEYFAVRQGVFAPRVISA
jgi:hypothetical protein